MFVLIFWPACPKEQQRLDFLAYLSIYKEDQGNIVARQKNLRV